MKAEKRSEERPGRRFVHLGERIDAVARVRAGEPADEVATDLGVTVDDVESWITVLAHERAHSLEELRNGGTPERHRLVLRARRLADLVAESERTLRDLHQELIHGITPSNDDDAGSSKELARNSPVGATRVAQPQRSAVAERKFVDGDSAR